MFKLTYRKSRTYFSSKCYFKDIVKISNEKNENCWSYAACRVEKSCFEKNAFKENTLPLTYFYLEMLLTEHKKKLSNDIHCVLEKLEIKR